MTSRCKTVLAARTTGSHQGAAVGEDGKSADQRHRAQQNVPIQAEHGLECPRIADFGPTPGNSPRSLEKQAEPGDQHCVLAYGRPQPSAKRRQAQVNDEDVVADDVGQIGHHGHHQGCTALFATEKPAEEHEVGQRRRGRPDSGIEVSAAGLFDLRYSAEQGRNRSRAAAPGGPGCRRPGSGPPPGNGKG